VSLKFKGPHIDDTGIKKLGKAFSHLHNLNYVKVDLSQCEKVSNKGVTKLSRTLSQLDNLSHFEMNLWWTQVTATGIQDIQDLFNDKLIKLEVHHQYQNALTRF